MESNDFESLSVRGFVFRSYQVGNGRRQWKNRLPKPGVLDRSSEIVDRLNSMTRNNCIRLSSQYMINNIIKGVITYKGILQIASSYESPGR